MVIFLFDVDGFSAYRRITLRARQTALQLRQGVPRVLLPAFVMPTMTADEVNLPPAAASIADRHALDPRRARRLFFGEELAHSPLAFLTASAQLSPSPLTIKKPPIISPIVTRRE